MKNKLKKNNGCLMIIGISVMAMVVAGLFYTVGGRLLGEEYRNLFFFGFFGTIGIVFLIREIFFK